MLMKEGNKWNASGIPGKILKNWLASVVLPSLFPGCFSPDPDGNKLN